MKTKKNKKKKTKKNKNKNKQTKTNKKKQTKKNKQKKTNKKKTPRTQIQVNHLQMISTETFWEMTISLEQLLRNFI